MLRDVFPGSGRHGGGGGGDDPSARPELLRAVDERLVEHSLQPEEHVINTVSRTQPCSDCLAKIMWTTQNGQLLCISIKGATSFASEGRLSIVLKAQDLRDMLIFCDTLSLLFSDTAIVPGCDEWKRGSVDG